MDFEFDEDTEIDVGLPEPAKIDIPEELVYELAMGMEEPDDLAKRHGVPDALWAHLKVWEPFLLAVEKQKAEFERSGVTFKLKAKLLTADVFEEAFKLAKSTNTSLLQKLEFIKLGAKLADMEPKTTAQNTSSNPGFTINITLPNQTAPTSTVVDVTPTLQSASADLVNTHHRTENLCPAQPHAA